MTIKIVNEPLNGRTLQEVLDYVMSRVKAEMKVKHTALKIEDLQKSELSRPDQHIYNLPGISPCGVELPWGGEIVINHKRECFSAQVQWDDECPFWDDEL